MPPSGGTRRISAFRSSDGSRKQGFVWLKAGEWTRLGLWLAGERQFGDRPGAHVHFAMRVDRADLPTLADELRAKGLAVEGPVHHDGKDSSIYIKDPDGHLIEFFDYEPQKDQPGEARERVASSE